MRIIESVSEMQQQADVWRGEGKRIALVPTMGYLHAGHLTLMQKARNHAEMVVMSVFVNPAQFGPGEDFDRYPRDRDRDMRLAQEAGVDVVFSPGTAAMYPDGYQTFIEVTEVTRPLCGKSRPGHFRGVATVVAKLLNIVKPHTAIFGEKDFQQLVVIRRMVQDLNMDVEILGHPIVREADGLAMSSRNVYLNPEQRKDALRLSQSLREAQALVQKGERSSTAILAEVRKILQAGKDMHIDYTEMRHPETLQEVPRIESPTLLALAVFLGTTRLIDNCMLQVSANTKGVQLRSLPDGGVDSHTHVCLFLPDSQKAAEFHKKITSAGVSAIYFKNNLWHFFHNWEHLLSKSTAWPGSFPFCETFCGSEINYTSDMLPKTEQYLSRTIVLPISLRLTETGIDRICVALESAAKTLL